MPKLKQLDAPVLELNRWQAPADRQFFDSEKRAAKQERRIYGVVTGRLVAWDRFANPLVVFHGIEEPGLPARSTVVLNNSQTGRDVVLMFENGAIDAPVILGLIENPVPLPATQHAQGMLGKPTAEIDGKSLVLTAEKEIVLRCGDASITLTRAGKVIIRGTYVVSRSSGVNRIKGGVVHIN